MQTVYSNPLFGLGVNVGSWDRASWMGGSVHNFWLLMTMRYGVPAFLMLAFAIFVMVRQATKLPLTSPGDQACRTGYLISLAGVIIAGEPLITGTPCCPSSCSWSAPGCGDHRRPGP